ncbi:hypothetical protein BOTNAR_0048g00140 [Botryotinia narcissicola]|uniref:Uncharacterized protein n=1 Tax=Botryotinia narcissicola TaxID=278944 RepID=A0A4Z1J1R1_9HELO|nr:hypothetical protein BOTNAR_0048g00140 [Botryotinia narcissicola]
MSGNMQGVQMEGLAIQEAQETVTFFVENIEVKINKGLLFRKVPALSRETFPLKMLIDLGSFTAFSKWLHEDKLPMLLAIYHESNGTFRYSGYIPGPLYRMAVFLELATLADNIMDCVRKAHNSLGVGYTKNEIANIYRNQLAHLGLTLFASLWIHLEDTRPNNFMKLTTKAERDELMKNNFIATDVAIHRRPGYMGNQTRCFYHLHRYMIGWQCMRTHRTDIRLWVLDKHGVLHDLQAWRAKTYLQPVKTESDSTP